MHGLRERANKRKKHVRLTLDSEFRLTTTARTSLYARLRPRRQTPPTTSHLPGLRPCEKRTKRLSRAREAKCPWPCTKVPRCPHTRQCRPRIALRPLRAAHARHTDLTQLKCVLVPPGRARELSVPSWCRLCERHVCLCLRDGLVSSPFRVGMALLPVGLVGSSTAVRTSRSSLRRRVQRVHHLAAGDSSCASRLRRMTITSAISGRSAWSVFQQRVSNSASSGGKPFGIFGRSCRVHTRR